MNCLQFENTLAEYLEGSRTPEQQAHLTSCSACSTLLSDLDLIRSDAFSLRELEEPSARVWNALEAQLRSEGLIRSQIPGRSQHSSWLRWRSAWLVPVAAALVIAAGIKFYQPARVGDNQPIAKQSVASPAAEPAVSPEDKDLMTTVAARQPSHVTTYRKDLDQANAFIRDAQDAVRNNPNDIYSQQMLINAYEQKQMLFRLAVDQGDDGE
jgi:hypothetical protein